MIRVPNKDQRSQDYGQVPPPRPPALPHSPCNPTPAMLRLRVHVRVVYHHVAGFRQIDSPSSNAADEAGFWHNTALLYRDLRPAKST